MTDRPNNSTRLMVGLEEQDYDELVEVAATRSVSLSWLIWPFTHRSQSVDKRGEDIFHSRDSKRD